MIDNYITDHSVPIKHETCGLPGLTESIVMGQNLKRFIKSNLVRIVT